MVSSILVGVDDSDSAAAALEWAAALAAAERARGRRVAAVAVAAWNPPVLGLAGLDSPLDPTVLEQATIDSVERALAKLDDPGSFEGVARLGPPAEVILEEAERRQVDLVVVGSRGRGGLTQLLLGSVSRAVAARANCPVAVVPAGATWSDGPTVVGYDGSAGAEAALAWAVANSHGPLTVVSAWHLPTDAIYDPAALDVAGFEAEIGQRLEAAVEALGPAAADRVSTIIQRDDPRLVLVNEAADATMLVLGARAHRGLRGLVLGSTVDYVATHCRQAVVVVPPPDDDVDREGGHG